MFFCSACSIWDLKAKRSSNKKQQNCQHCQQVLLLLDVVIAESSPILQLFASEDQALLVRRDACAEHVAKGQPAHPSVRNPINIRMWKWEHANPIILLLL